MKNLYFLIVAFFMLSSFTGFSQRSQTKFIESAGERVIELSGDRKNKFDMIRQNRVYKEVSMVRIGDLSAFVENGELSFSIPGRVGKIIAKTIRVEAYSNTEYLWEGELTNLDGHVMIMGREGRVFGYINIGNEMYEIQDLGDEYNLLIKIDKTQITGNTCLVIDSGRLKSAGDLENSGARVLNHGLERVRALVLFTQNAENSVANINDHAALVIGQTNSALSNSGISIYQHLIVELAGVQELLNFNETGNIFDDLDT